MKNIINTLGAAAFAPVLFCFFIISCGSGGAKEKPTATTLSSPDTTGNNSQPRKMAATSSSPDTTANNSQPKAMLSCLNNDCGSITMSSPDTTGNPGGPKLVFVGRSSVAIPANTDIKLVVYLNEGGSPTTKMMKDKAEKQPSK
jgi:hypothetical protein